MLRKIISAALAMSLVALAGCITPAPEKSWSGQRYVYAKHDETMTGLRDKMWREQGIKLGECVEVDRRLINHGLPVRTCVAWIVGEGSYGAEAGTIIRLPEKKPLIDLFR